MQVRDIFINGIGVFLPALQGIGSAVEQGLLTAETVENLEFTSVAVAGDTPAPEMTLRAARDALKHSGVSPGDVALLLYVDVWHQGPASWQPQLYLQHYLVGDEVLAVEVKHGCVGMLSGIELSVGFLRADAQHKAVLIASGDNFGTPLMNRWTSGAGFTALGDGASAVVLTKESGVAQLLSVCTASYSEMEESWRAGEPFFPPGVTVRREVDFVGGKDVFKEKMTPAAMGAISISHVQRVIECAKRALAEAELETSDIKRVITDNMPRGEAENYLNLLGFSLDQSVWDFGSGVGHVGANDHMLSLHHLLTTAQVSPGDHVLICGMSPGVTYKSAVLKILEVR